MHLLSLLKASLAGGIFCNSVLNILVVLLRLRLIVVCSCRKEATKLAKKNRKRKKNKKIKLERNLPFTFGVTSSRKLIGFVTSGDFLFSFATGGAIGFITLQSVVTLYRMKMDSEWLQKFLSDVNHANGLLCLMKNIDTDQYRFAIVNLVLTENK